MKVKAKIEFTLPERIYKGTKHFRPVFNFGDDLLFSGTVVGNHEEYTPNQIYNVEIDFFTIEEDAYEAIKDKLIPNYGLTIQEGSKIIGFATLL